MNRAWLPQDEHPDGERVVWAGRHDDVVVDGLGEWVVDRVELYARLDRAPELVVVDALSFPWDALRPVDRDIPMVVALPPELDAAQLDAVLGEVLLRQVTPHDRLIESRSEVRSDLARRHALPESTWLPGDNRDPVGLASALDAYGRTRLVEVSTDIGSFLLQDGDLITEQLREFGAHQRGDLNALLAVLHPDDVVLDVGAHVGTFAVPVASHLGPEGRLVAFEGHPATAALLAENVTRNGIDDRVEVCQAIVGTRGGPGRSPTVPVGNTGGTWFHAATAADVGARETVALDDWWAGRDDALPVTVVKIDVEGAELDVLAGAERLVKEVRPVIMLEVARVQLERHGASITDLDAWLAARAYELFVSTGERNTTRPDHRLERVPSLAGRNESVFDVIAVPRGSARFDEVGT